MTNEEAIKLACKPLLDRIKFLEDAVYHTRPDEMMFGGEGWTWKQQALATEDRLKECEARVKELERVREEDARMYQAELDALRETVRVLGEAVKRAMQDTECECHSADYDDEACKWHCIKRIVNANPGARAAVNT